MVNITDNKKVAQLVIEAQNDSTNYEAINPNSLAHIITQFNDGQALDKSVQDHINDSSIHLTEERVSEITSEKITAENVIGGANITVERDGNNVTISTGTIPQESFMTQDSVVPMDETITVEPYRNPETGEESENKIFIRANIPDTSHFVLPRNIRAENETVNVHYGRNSNDVLLSANPVNYTEGSGIDITDLVITNTMPDQIVEINAGSNVTVEGEYPTFTISAKDDLKVSPWTPYTSYEKDTLVTHNGGLFVCLEDHTSNGRVIGILQENGTVVNSETAEVIGRAVNGIVYDLDDNQIGVVINGIPVDGAFQPEYWEMLAAWSIKRQIFNVTRATRTLVLNEVMPSKDCIIVNIAGVMQSSDNYSLDPDGQTLKFIEPIPADSQVEVIMMGNTILNAYEEGANIDDWSEDTSYIIGNIVIFDNGLYKCIEKHISGGTFDKTKWELIAGYSKKSYFFQSSEPTTTLVLPNAVFNANDIMINVGNTLLMSNNYTLSSDGKTITFIDPIEANAEIEVVVFGHAILQDTQVPSPSLNESNYMLKVNDRGSGYELISPQEAAENIGLGTIANYNGENNKFIKVNNDSSDYEFVNANNVAGEIGVPSIANGLLASYENASKTPIPGTTIDCDDSITINKGSIISKDGSTLIKLNQSVTKKLNEAYSYGNNQGSMLGSIDNEWESPIMSSSSTEYSTVSVKPENGVVNDREGWRAMDGRTAGNGWLSTVAPSIWQYQSAYSFKVTRFVFRNTKSGYNTEYSKDIDLWSANINNPQDYEKTIVASFTALNSNEGLTDITIENPVYGKFFGMDVKTSYGTAVGAKEIKMYGFWESYVIPDRVGYIYVISNDDGTITDFATSFKYEDEIESLLPEGMTKYALIGTFTMDSTAHISRVYPSENINEAYITEKLLTNESLTELLNIIYPVGAAYTTYNDSCPIQIGNWTLSTTIGNNIKVFKRVS